MTMHKAMRFATLFCLSLFVTTLQVQAEGDVSSGLAVGEATLSFTVTDVTGVHNDKKRICYVCEYQDEPNVIGFFQDTGEETGDMIVKLNELYVSNKDRGLQAFAVIVAGKSAAPWLQELNQSQDIEIPLVVLRKGPKDLAVRMYNLDPEIENTFLVNINREVKANFNSIEPGSFEQVAEATTQMLSQNNL